MKKHLIVLSVFFVVSANLYSSDDVITGLRKIPGYNNMVYQKLIGFAPVKGFYDGSDFEYRNESQLLCSYIYNMHLLTALYSESKDIDLRFIGAIDSLEINADLVRKVEEKGWLNTYNENKKDIQDCIKEKFTKLFYNVYIYDSVNPKNTLLETTYLSSLSLSRLDILDDNRPVYYHRYVYGHVANDNNILADKKLTSDIRDILLALVSPGLVAMSPGGRSEEAVVCTNVADSTDSEINHTRNRMEVICNDRLTKFDCSDSTYLVNKSISQYFESKKNIVRLLKLYSIRAYDGKKNKNGEQKRINVNRTKTAFGVSTSGGYKFHEASLVVLQNVKDKEMYMAVVDNFFNILPMTFSEWLGLFSDPSSELRFCIRPYGRDEKTEENYMSMAEAKAYIKVHSIKPQ